MLLGLACMVCMSCAFIAAPLPSNAQPFTPPAVYARWWAMTEVCSGRSGDLNAVRWYRVPGYQFNYRGQTIGGFTTQHTDRIVLADQIIEDGSAVRHEMLHALLRRTGHPRSEFLGKCAALVECQDLCVKDAGPWRSSASNYLILPSDSLDVTSHAELLPREPDGERWLALLVIVRNQRPHAVIARVRGSGKVFDTFGFDFRGGPSGGRSGGEVATDSSAVFFQPFEVKQWLFEFRVVSTPRQREVAPGRYVVRGNYGEWGRQADTVTVMP